MRAQRGWLGVSIVLLAVAGASVWAWTAAARTNTQQLVMRVQFANETIHAAWGFDLGSLRTRVREQCDQVSALIRSSEFTNLEAHAKIELLSRQLYTTDRFLAFDEENGMHFETAYANPGAVGRGHDWVQLGQRTEHCLREGQRVSCSFANTTRWQGNVLRLRESCGSARIVVGTVPNSILWSSEPGPTRPSAADLATDVPTWALHTGGIALVLAALILLRILVVRPLLSSVNYAESDGASVQMLARHLAHEVKNPLMPIRMSIETIRRVKERAHPEFDRIFDESTQMVLGEVQRLERLANQFAELAGPLHPRRAPTRMQDVLSYVVQLHSPKKEGGATFTDHPDAISVRAIPSGELSANIDAELVKQALVNLVKNAREAIAPERAGTIRLSVRHDRTFVVLDVEDSGPGFAEQRASAAVYVSTKVGGSGIGLLMVRRIAAAHGGRVEVASSSELGGAKVSLYLAHASD